MAASRKIEGRIIGQRIVSTATEAAENAPVVAQRQPDVDPRRVPIERREEGAWESITVKVKMPGAAGTVKLYFVIGFGVVCGRKDGREVCIERPLEFFVPAGQLADSHQWVSATMRSLSLAARGGFLEKALEDLRQVTSPDPVWFGTTRSGKPMTHASVVAALAWAIQDELRKRGYFDEHYRERPLEDLVAQYERIRAWRDTIYGAAHPVGQGSTPASGEDARREAVVGTCREPGCGGDMVLKDGCATCLDCGYSKCG